MENWAHSFQLCHAKHKGVPEFFLVYLMTSKEIAFTLYFQNSFVTA